MSSNVHVTVPHISVAVPVFPLAANHASRSAVFPAPSHSTISSSGAVSIVGGVVSSIVNVANDSLEFPHSSVTMNA